MVCCVCETIHFTDASRTASSHNIVSQPSVRRTPSSHKCNYIVSQTQLNRLTNASSSNRIVSQHRLTAVSSSNCIVSQTQLNRLTNASCIVSQTKVQHRLTNASCIVSQTQLRRTASSHKRKFELHRLTKIVSQTEVRRTASSHKRNLMHRLTNASSYRLTNAIVVELCCTIARTVLRRSRGGRPCGQTGGVARVGVKRS